MILFLILLLTISVFLEGTVTTLPLSLIFLLCFLIVRRSRFIFFSAFLAGLVLDLMRVQPLGSTAIFFLTFLYLVLLYNKKYEINSYPFVAASAFLGSWLYLVIFGYTSALMQAIVSSLIAGVLFAVLSLKFK